MAVFQAKPYISVPIPIKRVPPLRVIVSLSSIPSRFSSIGPTLLSILRQTTPPDEIRLYIPHRYRRFPDWDGALPAVPEGVDIHRCAEDFGPATKVLPAVRDLRGEDAEILFCDDDRIYDPEWLGRFVAGRTAHPDCAIVEAGRFVPGFRGTATPRARPRRKGWRYRLARIASLGLYAPPPWVSSGHVDVLKGFGGVLIRPQFIPDFAFDIPDILWTVDDPWLSGCLAANGVDIWLNAGTIPSIERRIAGRDSLLKFSVRGHGRDDANHACFRWFQGNRGIWVDPPKP